MVGDPLEKATLKYVDWTLTKGETVVPQKRKTHGLKIYQRFHFQSSLKRMSVIVGHTPVGSTEVNYMATVKVRAVHLSGLLLLTSCCLFVY